MGGLQEAWQHLFNLPKRCKALCLLYVLVEIFDLLVEGNFPPPPRGPWEATHVGMAGR